MIAGKAAPFDTIFFYRFILVSNVEEKLSINKKYLDNL